MVNGYFTDFTISLTISLTARHGLLEAPHDKLATDIDGNQALVIVRTGHVGPEKLKQFFFFVSVSVPLHLKRIFA